MIRRRVCRPESLWELLGLGAPGDMAWVSDALCAQTDPDAFFPDDGVVPRSAKAVCRVCPVREACLAFAMAHGELYHGVWGGLSALERRALRARIAVGVAA